MPRRVKGPDGVIRSFPDDATDDEISAALSEQASPAAPDTANTDSLSKLLGLLPMAGGTVGGIAGGIGGTAFGMGVGGVPGAMGGAALGGAGGEALRQLLERLRGADVPTTPTDAAKQIGVQGSVNAASELVGGAVTKGVAKGAKAVYRGFLKPSLSAGSIGSAREIVDTAIREGLPISRKGINVAQKTIDKLNTEVERILSTQKGSVDLHVVAEKVRAFAKREFGIPGVDPGDYEAALKVADSLDKHPSLGLPAGAKPSRVDVSLPAAQASKRGLYRSVKDAGFGTPQGATKETQKVAARGIKEGLEKAAPAVGPLNAREGKLIEAAEAIAKAVEREANQSQIHGAKTMVATMAGGASFANDRDPAGALATTLIVRAGLHPAVATKGAIIASRLAKMTGVSAATAARVAYHTVASGQQQGQ